MCASLRVANPGRNESEGSVGAEVRSSSGSASSTDPSLLCDRFE